MNATTQAETAIFELKPAYRAQLGLLVWGVLLLPVVGVREEYLETALARVAQMGGMNAYLEHLGVSEETRVQLRDRLIE